MTRRSKVWLVLAVLFIFVNLGGAGIAAARGEVLHTGLHAGLLLLGVYGVRRIWRQGGSAIAAAPRDLTDRLTHLEQSVDAIAIEVERIGEGQRFMTRLFTENGASRAPGEGAAAPIDVKAQEAAPHVRGY